MLDGQTELWPEFGVHGKATATLRHALTHTVGLSAKPREITPDGLPNWSKVCAAPWERRPRADFGNDAEILGAHIPSVGTATERSAAFGWPGGGGSSADADPERGIAFALTKNRLVPDFDTAVSLDAILADHLA